MSGIVVYLLWFCLFTLCGGEVGDIIMLDDCVLLTQSIYVRGLSKKQYNVLVDTSLNLNVFEKLCCGKDSIC